MKNQSIKNKAKNKLNLKMPQIKIKTKQLWPGLDSLLYFCSSIRLLPCTFLVNSFLLEKKSRQACLKKFGSWANPQALGGEE